MNLDASFDPVRNIILDLREKVESMCNQELDKINKTGQEQSHVQTHRCIKNILLSMKDKITVKGKRKIYRKY